MEDKLVKHGAIIFAGATAVNLLNYIFQLAMARLLTPVEYGALIALFALFNIFVIAASSVSTISTKFASVFWSRKELGKIKFLVLAYGKIILVFSALLLIIVFFLHGLIAGFMQISDSALILFLFFGICVSYFNSMLSGMLNGMQRFFSLVLMNISNASTKFVLGILLVFFGFGVAGAVDGLVAGGIIGALAGFFLLGNVFAKKSEKFEIKKTLSYSAWIFAGFICLAVLSNIDVVLVKHFFSGEEAGVYSAAFTLARIIFFATSSLTIVLLPKAVSAHSLKQNTSKILKKALLIMALLCIASTLAYFTLPSLIVNLLVGSNYASAVPLLGIFALVTSVFSFVNLLAVYFTSIHRKKFSVLLLAFSVLEIILIFLFHSSLLQVLYILLGVQSALLAAMAAYFFFDFKRDKIEFD
ncbi:MAG TPA: oligosaccharide flippase family protein [archaeon]|nr:oligosaccharide flippase family protein [archaeon]